MRTKIGKLSIRLLITLASLSTLLLSSCSLSLLNIPVLNPSTATPTTPAGPTATPQPAAAVTFNVTLPTPLLAGEALYLSVVDEVTGLGLNPVNYTMQSMDALHYSATIPLALNSVIKYRYMRQGTLPTLEDDSADKSVRYRMYYVTGSGTAEDVVSSWSDSLFSSPYGRIIGQILDASNSDPIPNILVVAGGQQTLTDSAGNFSLEKLPAGTHNLVAYALDGSYQTFQQGARVEADKITQANLSLTPARMVNVIFTVTIPADSIKNVPVRLAGNLYQLGNTFGDLQGGMSTVATRMPLLTPMADGRYTVSLELPVGADIRYKYTLGDGFWNAEHAVDGTFTVRQLIVPGDEDTVQVQDVVQTWKAGPSSPILFEASLPADTPAIDIPSIQFNPYGWTEPIPMWPVGNNRWVYQLNSPLNMLGDFEYRYCRNDQCGVADDVQTGVGQRGRSVSTSLAPQDLQDTVVNWAWFQPSASYSPTKVSVTARPSGFWAGVEFLPDDDPTWKTWLPTAIQDVQIDSANWLVLTPSWTVSRTSPFVFSPVPGSDTLWSDNQDTISRARAANLNVALFPAANLPADCSSWWLSSPRSAEWWETWFARYAAFVNYHADLATQSGAQALILGGDWLAPALPNGTLSEGSNSGVPADAGERWNAIIAGVRQRFSGQVLWAASYTSKLESLPDFASSLDGIYLLWYAPLDGTNSSTADLQSEIGQLLDSDIQTLSASVGKPIIIAAAYPSVEDAASATMPISALFQPGTTQGTVDLQAQADVYQALMAAINERSWIGGFVSRGYYPPVGLQDASASIHAKPAAEVLKYWYPRFLGITP